MRTPWKITSSRLQGVRALLKLLRCEFAKLKRKPLFFAAAAISALIPLGCALFLPEMQEFSSGAEAVDRLMSTLFQLSAYLLLMPAVVVLASNLLFEEQDNDTLKNLMTVPVSKPALALAKMTLLFLFSIAFMAIGGLVNLASAGLRAGAGRLLETVFCRHRSRDHDVGRGAALRPPGSAFEPQLHYLRNHYVLLHCGQLYFWHQRLFHHAALWVQSRYAVTRTADLPLVLSVSGHIRRTDDGIDGADQSLLCDNAPSVLGRYPGVGSIPDIDRTGL